MFGFCLHADLPSLHLITQFDSFIKFNRRKYQSASWSKTNQWLKLSYWERPDPKHFHLVSCWNLYDFSLLFFFSFLQSITGLFCIIYSSRLYEYVKWGMFHYYSIKKECFLRKHYITMKREVSQLHILVSKRQYSLVLFQ